jgi:hypothetical protein
MVFSSGRIGEVLAVFGALEGAGFSDERAGDDAADAQGVAQAAGDVAIAVEFGDGHDFLVGGDLEDAVGGGVADQRAGLHVFFAEFVEDGGAAGGLVADELAAGFLLKGGDQVGGERVHQGEVVEAGIHFEAGDFPVAGDGVLAVGHFAHGAPGGDGGFLGGHAFDLLGGVWGSSPGMLPRPIFCMVGTLRPPAAAARMREGRGAGVAVFGRVGGGADAHGVENDQDGFHLRPSFFAASGAAGLNLNIQYPMSNIQSSSEQPPGSRRAGPTSPGTAIAVGGAFRVPTEPVGID